MIKQKFYCLGVPRSGTTYFSHLINSHLEAVCGMESFNPKLFRNYFLSLEGFESKSLSQHSKNFVSERFEKKGSVDTIGDKYPRGYYAFENIVVQMNGVSGTIFINIRKPEEVFASWDTRALDSHDSWDSGMIWLVSYLEMIYLLHVVKKFLPDNSYFLNYEYVVGLESRKEAAKKIFELLNKDIDSSVTNYLSKSAKRTQISIHKERQITSQQKTIMMLPHMCSYSTLLQKITVTPTTEIVSDISIVLEYFKKDFIESQQIFREVIHNTVKLCPEFKILWKSKLSEQYSQLFIDDPFHDLWEMFNNIICREIV